MIKRPQIMKKVTSTLAVKFKTEEKKQKEYSRKYPDEYKEEFPSTDIVLSEEVKLVIQCKRGGEMGLPFVDVRTYVCNETYTGFTKKGITLPVDRLDELVTKLSQLYENCEEKGLLNEFEEDDEVQHEDD